MCYFHTYVIYYYSGSVDGNNQLIIRGRFNQKQIENVLRRYISKYTVEHSLSHILKHCPAGTKSGSFATNI